MVIGTNGAMTDYFDVIMVLKEHTIHIVLVSILAWNTKPTGMAESLPYASPLQKQSFQEKNSVSSYNLLRWGTKATNYECLHST